MAGKKHAKRLTPKQEAFCLAYVETGSAVEAYRRAYKPTSTNANSIKATAGRTVVLQHIKARIAELQAPAAKKVGLTLESHLLELEKLRDKADQATDYGAAIRAEVARGKAAGLYVEKIDLNLTGSLAERLARARARNG